jgi:hypothetical protein
MYNMEITIGSYKVRVVILIAIVVLFWIMFGHILCGCSKVALFEGLGMMKEYLTNGKPARRAAVANNENNNNTRTTEGFANPNNTDAGPEFAGAKTPSYIMNPSTWSMPTLTYSPGTTPSAGVQAIWDRPKQPIPLPEGQLDMFATTEFKPECCPNTYSSSTGCACMDMGTYGYLRERGGNNVPYSDF